MSDINVGLIIKGDSRDARREIDRTEKEVDQLKRGTRQLGRESQNYGRRAVAANRQVARSHRNVGAAIVPLKRAIVGVAAAYAGLIALRGGAQLAGQFINAAREAEGFRVRLNTLLGSVYEGNRAFEEMAEFAGSVPFEYREIMSSATQLAGVMEGGVDEIREWMPMIADLAAVSGLTIEETTGQVIRMYSAGAASADMFRERGILAMLGFEAGVSVSAERTREKMVHEYNKAGSRIRGASADLAKNWDGITSMMTDSWFQFRDSMLEDTVLWDFLKTSLDEFRMFWADALDWNQSEFDAWAEGIITTIRYTGVAFTVLWDVVMAPKRIFDALIALNDTLVTLIVAPLHTIGAVSDETWNQLMEGAEESRRNVDRLNQTTSDFLTKMDEIEGKARNTFQLRQVNASIEESIALNEELFGVQTRVTQAMKETGEEGKKAMQSLDADIEKLIKNGELFATAWEKNLEDRFAATQNSLRTELEALEANRREQLEIIDAAERQGLASIVSFAELRRRVDEQYMEARGRLEQQGADQMEQIWDNAIENMQREFGDQIYDALWEDGIDDFGDFADAMLDIWKRMIAEMVAAYLVSGIAGFFSDEGGLSGFTNFNFGFGSDDSGSTGGKITNAAVSKAITTGIQKAGEKYLPQVFGGTTSGAGQELVRQGAQTYALESSAPITGQALGTGTQQLTQAQATQILTQQSAYTGAAIGGQAAAGQALTQAQATQILTSNAAYSGSSTAASGAAGFSWGAAGLAIPAIVGEFIKWTELGGFGNTPAHVNALRDIERHGFTGAGPLGLQVGAGKAHSFAGGANAGFAAEFLGGQGFDRGLASQPAGKGEGLLAQKGLGLDQLVAELEKAQVAFEETKTIGASVFQDMGVSAAEVGQIISNGMVVEAKKARLGIENVRIEMRNAENGSVRLREVTSEEFRQIVRAIKSGELRLAALRNQVELTEDEMQVLKRITLDTTGDIAVGFGEIGSAAWAAANDANRALSSIQDRTVNVGINKSFGGAPPQQGPVPGLAHGGIVSTRGVYELSEYNHPELVVPLSGGRSVPVEMRGGGSDGEAKALLRSIDSRLGNLQAQTTLDDRSVAALAGAISRPLVDAQKRETRHADNRGRSFQK